MVNDFYIKLRELCIKEGMNWGNRDDLKSSRVEKKTSDKIAIAVKWKYIIPIEQYDSVLVMHDSLLPKLSGFNPLVTAVQNGDTISGVTCFKATRIIDAGPIFIQKHFELDGQATIKEASKKALNAYKQIIIEIFSELKLDPSNFLRKIRDLNSKAEDLIGNNERTYSIWRDKYDYAIDWAKSSIEVNRHIRSSSEPYLGAISLTSEGNLVRIHNSSLVDTINMSQYINPSCGKVVEFKEGSPIVMCGHGFLKISKVIDEATGLDITKKIRPRLRFFGREIVQGKLLGK